MDPGQISHSVSFDLGLHCLLRPVFPKSWSNYGNLVKLNLRRNHPGSVPEGTVELQWFKHRSDHGNLV